MTVWQYDVQDHPDEGGPEGKAENDRGDSERAHWGRRSSALRYQDSGTPLCRLKDMAFRGGVQKADLSASNPGNGNLGAADDPKSSHSRPRRRYDAFRAGISLVSAKP